MTTLSDAVAEQSRALTQAFKAQQNQEAAKMAALVALYYQQRVNVDDPRSVERWLDIVVPRLISTSDTGARNAVAFFQALRRLEVPGSPAYTPQASLGLVDPGVRKSLMAVGPGDFLNKARDIQRLDVSPQQQKALLLDAKQVTTTKLAAAATRHAQAGGRDTIFRNVEADQVALGYVRVTRAKPCHFCALLASRGLRYRAYKEGSFANSDARFTGDGDAKVHDQCGCSLKPVYVTNDPLVAATEKWADMYSRWGAGGGDAALRFRRGYTRWAETGEFISFEQANEGLRPV